MSSCLKRICCTKARHIWRQRNDTMQCWKLNQITQMPTSLNYLKRISAMLPVPLPLYFREPSTLPPCLVKVPDLVAYGALGRPERRTWLLSLGAYNHRKRSKGCDRRAWIVGCVGVLFPFYRFSTNFVAKGINGFEGGKKR
jgi:hypothetical protein